MSAKKSIARFEQLPPALKKIQEDNGTPFMVGDMFFTERDTDVIRISKIQFGDKYSRRKEWYVEYEEATDWECTEWRDYSHHSFEQFSELIKKGMYTKITKPFNELMAEANKLLSGEISTDVYSQSVYDEGMNEERALMGRSSKDGLIAIQNELEIKRSQAELIHSAVRYEMERRKAELDVIRRNLYGAIEKFEKQIKKIMRVITTIELYLGIEEELHQIQSGEKAPQKTPISFRQLVLYMDEEVGSHENGGIDFNSIEEFDKWLVTGNNIDIVLPEKKGIVVLNPRRKDKDYGTKNPFLEGVLNLPNHINTYILIRNGDNIYRIFTEKLVIKNRLFPLKTELQNLYDKMQKEHFDSRKEEIEDEMYKFKKQAILLQGLIDRTDIFHPLPIEQFSIFKMHEHKDVANFIYDAEASLHDGRPMFREWQKKINAKIEHGSRILIFIAETTGEFVSGYGRSHGYYSSNNRLYNNAEHTFPDPPPTGLYTVEEYKGGERTTFVDDADMQKHKDNKTFVRYVYLTRGGKHKIVVKDAYDEPHLTVMYNPKDEVGLSGWTYNPHVRKNRLRYRIHKDDTFILNYDQLDLSDLDYYLKSRANREDYLHMMPILKDAIKFRKKEMAKEEYFIQFITGRNEQHLPHLSHSKIEERVRESVRWWKYKNKWKRPIDKDDASAMKMIEQRILSKNYSTFTKHNVD